MFSDRFSAAEQDTIRTCIAAVLDGQFCEPMQWQVWFHNDRPAVQSLHDRWPTVHGSTDFEYLSCCLVAMRDAERERTADVRAWMMSGGGEYNRLLKGWLDRPRNNREWLTGYDPQPMIVELGPRGYCSDFSGRKLRLLACACIRRAWRQRTPQHGWDAVEAAERYVDGAESPETLAQESAAARQFAFANHEGLALAAAHAAQVSDKLAPLMDAVRNAALAAVVVRGQIPQSEQWRAERGPQWDAERQAQADLLRHLVGNPFQPLPEPVVWASRVTDLARQLYDGGDVRLILHDALLDAGHAELAEHFRAEEWHPKGCWVLDLLLGKT